MASIPMMKTFATENFFSRASSVSVKTSISVSTSKISLFSNISFTFKLAQNSKNFQMLLFDLNKKSSQLF